MNTLEELREGRLIGARRVSLRLGLEEFPRELYDLADTLEELDLSMNHLSSLPDDFGRLKNLKAVFFFDNQFESLPAVLKECPKLDIYGFRNNKISNVMSSSLPGHLRWLILTGNRLRHLPDDIGRLHDLQKLMLAGNALEFLPSSLGECLNLELIRLASNRLTRLPEWLVRLPRLAWLAFSANPLCDAMYGQRQQQSVPVVSWASLDIGEKLGEGASGIISRAVWRASEIDNKSVAVKVFKASLTSDGTPRDELRAWVAAGVHKNLVSVLGQVHDHPQGIPALISTLIPKDYSTMAGPPSLATCTRDTYPVGRKFSCEEIYNMALSVAKAGQHIHSCGILHGDFYPHNTFIRSDGYCVVGDFGAASFYDRTHPVFSEGLERLEIRAYGCYLDDTLTRVSDPNNAQKAKLEDLRDRCFNPVVSERPSFADIVSRLESDDLGLVN